MAEAPIKTVCRRTGTEEGRSNLGCIRLTLFRLFRNKNKISKFSPDSQNNETSSKVMIGAKDITRLCFSPILAGIVACKIKQSFYSVYFYSGIESINTP